MNLQNDNPLIPIDKFKDHFLLVLDLNSVQDAFENFQYPEQSEEPLRLELNFAFSLEYVSELNILGNECLR